MSLQVIVRSCEGRQHWRLFCSSIQFRIFRSRLVTFSLLSHNLIDNSFYRDEWDALSGFYFQPVSWRGRCKPKLNACMDNSLTGPAQPV